MSPFIRTWIDPVHMGAASGSSWSSAERAGRGCVSSVVCFCFGLSSFCVTHSLTPKTGSVFISVVVLVVVYLRESRRVHSSIRRQSDRPSSSERATFGPVADLTSRHHGNLWPHRWWRLWVFFAIGWKINFPDARRWYSYMGP